MKTPKKTEQAVNDLLHLIDTVQNDGASATAAQQNDDTSAASTGQKRDKHDDEDDEEEDDDDRNFKRRNVSTTTSAAEETSPRTGDKRTHSAEGDDRPSKQVRGDEQTRLSGLPSHLRQRLGSSSSGGEQRRKAPCRNFEERGYCIYGDSCKFDHGEEQITVNDYSKFQAIMGSSGSMAMPNPMMMQNPDQMYHFQMGMDGMPYMTPTPIEPSAEGQEQPHRQQRQSPHHPRSRQQRDGRMGGKYHDQPFTTRYDPNNNTIVVDKIPMESCNMEAVTETFKKFGTIVDISLQPEFQRAFIEYKTHAEALAAHQCPDVLFKNRFVKVYWKKMDDKQQKQQSWQQQQQQQPAEPDPEVIKQRAAELAKIREEKQKQRKEQLEKQIEANKRKQEIAKRELELAMLRAKVKAMEDSKKKETP